MFRQIKSALQLVLLKTRSRYLFSSSKLSGVSLVPASPFFLTQWGTGLARVVKVLIVAAFCEFGL